MAEIRVGGLNKSRDAYNGRLRELLGYHSTFPVAGDRLVCMRNNAEKGLFNGGMFNVLETYDPIPGAIKTKTIKLDVQSLDFDNLPAVAVDVREEFFRGNEGTLHWKQKRGTDEFKYGYALTVHKSQGSQWDNVMLFDESDTFRENWQRWLYTGITRAAERITIVQ